MLYTEMREGLAPGFGRRGALILFITMFILIFHSVPNLAKTLIFFSHPRSTRNISMVGGV